MLDLPCRVITGPTFGLIGDGYVAKYHREAIRRVGGQLVWVVDPKYLTCPQPVDGASYLLALGEVPEKFDLQNFGQVDYVVICSPSHLHTGHIRFGLTYGQQVLCEKPVCLPWEPMPTDDRINVVLQLRYAPLPEEAKRVRVQMVRDQAWLESWRGNPKLTGGLLYMLFVHYIDLAILLDCDFEGRVVTEGVNERKIETEHGNIDLLRVDMQLFYDCLYADLLAGKGIKASGLAYLHWQMNRHSELSGWGKNCIGKKVFIPRELL